MSDRPSRRAVPSQEFALRPDALAVLAGWYDLDDQHVRALRMEIAAVADELSAPPAIVLDALVEVTRTGRYPDDQQLAAGVKKLLGRVETDVS